MKKQPTPGTSSDVTAGERRNTGDRREGGERRDNERKYYPEPTGKIYLWVTVEKRIEAQVTDLALGGLAVVVDSDWKLEPGFQVRVEFKKEKYTAAIKSVNKLDDRRFRIGLVWDNS